MTDALIRHAAPADNEPLIDLIRRSPQGERLAVGSDRHPDFFRRAVPYNPAVVFVLDEAERLAGTVSCGMKDVLVGGERLPAAYVFDLAVDPRARGRGLAATLIARVEEWAREQHAAFLFAHVVAGNRGGLASFAAAGYRDVLRLNSRLIPVKRSAPASPGRPIEDSDWDDAAALIQDSMSRFDLVRPVDAPALRRLWESLPGYDPSAVLVEGRPARAVLGLWDYSGVTRTVLTRAGPEMQAAMAVLRGLSSLRLPLPAPPRIGQPFGYGLLLGTAGDPSLLRGLYHAALRRAAERGLEAVVFFHDPRSRVPWLSGLGIATRYHLIVKPLAEGRATTVGERPVWVDPADL